MINERQYKITTHKVNRLIEAIGISDDNSSNLPEVLQKSVKQGIQAQINVLKSELKEYENLKKLGC